MTQALRARLRRKPAPGVQPSVAVQGGRTNSQLSMFEPQGQILASLAATHQRTCEAERKRALNLVCSGFSSAANSRALIAAEAEQMAFICEMALQFEQLAGLS